MYMYRINRGYKKGGGGTSDRRSEVIMYIYIYTLIETSDFLFPTLPPFAPRSIFFQIYVYIYLRNKIELLAKLAAPVAG